MEIITGKSVVGKNFLKTRLHLVDELKVAIRNHSVIIEAPRRFGKTSVIKELIRQEKSKGADKQSFNIIFLELEGEENLNQFCFKFFKALLDLYSVKKRINSFGKMIGDTWNVIAERIPSLSIPEVEVELRAKTRNYDFSKWKEKIDPLIKGLNSFEKRTIIAFDEFPDMLMNFKTKGQESLVYEQAVDSLCSWLRSHREEEEDDSKYNFIFCGSVNLRKTLEEIGISKRINDLEPFVVPPLKRNEAETLIVELLKDSQIIVDRESIEFMVGKIEDGSPYYGQILLKAVKDTREKSLDFSQMKATYESMLRNGNHDLNHYHSRLEEEYMSPLEKEVCPLILRHLCTGSFQGQELYEIYLYIRCARKEFEKAVNRLIYEGYIKRSLSNGDTLAFVSPLLKDWWARKEGVE